MRKIHLKIKNIVKIIVKYRQKNVENVLIVKFDNRSFHFNLTLAKCATIQN